MKRKLEPEISEKVKILRTKLEVGERLTVNEKKLEVSRDEAAYILTHIAGRLIEPNYIKQLTRGENPRLAPTRAVGNTYLYTVESLLNVPFTQPHGK